MKNFSTLKKHRKPQQKECAGKHLTGCQNSRVIAGADPTTKIVGGGETQRREQREQVPHRIGLAPAKSWR